MYHAKVFCQDLGVPMSRLECPGPDDSPRAGRSVCVRRLEGDEHGGKQPDGRASNRRDRPVVAWTANDAAGMAGLRDRGRSATAPVVESAARQAATVRVRRQWAMVGGGVA